MFSHVDLFSALTQRMLAPAPYAHLEVSATRRNSKIHTLINTGPRFQTVQILVRDQAFAIDRITMLHKPGASVHNIYNIPNDAADLL